uniref:Alternative protein EPHA7 n=1 Tax=Homo sapiens TaxID=9606 RepID=L8EAA4_HUMAN|nr:alternative protein EPHA7 [Homo sapiens]
MHHGFSNSVPFMDYFMLHLAAPLCTHRGGAGCEGSTTAGF